MINSKQRLREYLASDLAAHGLVTWKAKYRLTKRIVYWQRLLRHAEYWTNCRTDILGSQYAKFMRLRLGLLGERLGFSIPLNVCGPGLSIAHVGTLVVNPHATIGSRCRIHQDVTVGEIDGMAPLIGDDVWIGPGAKLFGRISVGDGAAIGANAVVRSDVEPQTTVAGIPANKIRDFGYNRQQH